MTLWWSNHAVMITLFTWVKVPWKLVRPAGAATELPPSAALIAASMGPSRLRRMVSTRAPVSGPALWGRGAARAELANRAKHTNWKKNNVKRLSTVSLLSGFILCTIANFPDRMCQACQKLFLKVPKSRRELSWWWWMSVKGHLVHPDSLCLSALTTDSLSPGPCPLIYPGQSYTGGFSDHASLHQCDRGGRARDQDLMAFLSS